MEGSIKREEEIPWRYHLQRYMAVWIPTD